MYKFTITVFLLFLGSLFFSTTSQAQNRGDIVSYTLLNSYGTSYVDSLLVDFGIPAGFLKPNYDVDAYRVVYVTANAQGTDTTTATGLVTIPAGTTCPFPLAGYCHGTTSRRTNVPSYLATESNLGIIFSAVDGYVVALPDYLGLGDGPGFHPYIHAESEATATIDLLRATRSLESILGFQTSDQLFLFGYSQGGHASMATFKEIQENYSNEFTTTACAPMSGPYDVSGVQAQTLIDSVAYATPGYLPYVVLGMQEAYGNLYTDLSEVFVPPYDSLLPILFDGVTSLGTINNIVPDTPNLMLDSAQFVDFKNNPNNPMRIALEDNDLYDWVPTAPLRMMYCTQDEQVFYLNSVVTKDTMDALGAQNVEALNMGPYDHNGCVQFCMLDARSFFNQYSDHSGGITVSTSIVSPTSTSNNDGSAEVVASGGVAPYTYSWNTGETSNILDRVDDGVYVVRIQDSRGCYYDETVQIDYLSSVLTNDDARKIFSIFPNPTSGKVNFTFTNAVEVESDLVIRNTLGQVVYRTPNLWDQSLELDMGGMPAGLYLVELHQANQVYTQKLILR